MKKRGLDKEDRKNFRPLSNLTCVSTLLERIVGGQLMTFLGSSNALPESQSAYRSLQSTESALLKLFSDLNLALAHGHVALLGLLDLSAAFDTVDHDVLLKRLEISYGVTGVPLQWLKSYLAGRVQTIAINRSRLSAVKLSFSVPQGSVLSSILNVLYTKDVTAIIKRHGL